MSTTPRDPWVTLATLTAARIGLGRAGGSLPTPAHLAFQLAHAEARDAVHHEADLGAVAARLEARGRATVLVASEAPDRTTYLQRPDLGRRLSPAALELLASLAPPGGCDLALVLADGLSGVATERHAAPVAELVIEAAERTGWVVGPIVLARQGRVALGDEIGACLGARMVLILIGERPGLSSPDSLGAYLTWAPRVGRTDAERNCVSNIRPGGLPAAVAAERIGWLLREGARRKLTGVGLKEEVDGGLLR
jgi:ethanolamine ammonia-lyase small subunit